MEVSKYNLEFAQAIYQMWPSLSDKEKCQIGGTISEDHGSGEIAEILEAIMNNLGHTHVLDDKSLATYKEYYLPREYGSDDNEIAVEDDCYV